MWEHTAFRKVIVFCVGWLITKQAPGRSQWWRNLLTCCTRRVCRGTTESLMFDAFRYSGGRYLGKWAEFVWWLTAVNCAMARAVFGTVKGFSRSTPCQYHSTSTPYSSIHISPTLYDLRLTGSLNDALSTWTTVTLAIIQSNTVGLCGTVHGDCIACLKSSSTVFKKGFWRQWMVLWHRIQQKNREHYVMKADSSLDSFLLWRNRPTGAQAASLLRFRYHTQTHTQSIGLLWTRDRPDAETCAWQQTTFTRDIHTRPPTPGGIRTHSLSKRVAADTRLDRATTGVGHH